jgi:hypothetical protein
MSLVMAAVRGVDVLMWQGGPQPRP